MAGLRRHAGAWVLAGLLAGVAVDAGLAEPRAEPPTPPCAGPAQPPYSAVVGRPEVVVWFQNEGDAGWTPPACTGWKGDHFTVLVATAGRFRHAGDGDDLLGRMGAISGFEAIRYWSVTRGRWNDLVSRAYAVEGAAGEARRADFSLAEMQVGRRLYFRQIENTPAGDVVYGIRIAERAPGRLVVAVENAGPISWLLLPLFDPGGHQFLYYFEREAPGRWRYYSLARARLKWSFPFLGPVESYINRAVAVFRHLTGIPTDREPPPAP